MDKEQMNLFLSDIKALRLRFPVATIARKMKANRANVSLYVRGVKPASVMFVLQFYAEFEKELASIGIKRDLSVYLVRKPGIVVSSIAEDVLQKAKDTRNDRPIEYIDIQDRLRSLSNRLDKVIIDLEGIVVSHLNY